MAKQTRSRFNFNLRAEVTRNVATMPETFTVADMIRTLEREHDMPPFAQGNVTNILRSLSAVEEVGRAAKNAVVWRRR